MVLCFVIPYDDTSERVNGQKPPDDLDMLMLEGEILAYLRAHVHVKAAYTNA